MDVGGRIKRVGLYSHQNTVQPCIKLSKDKSNKGRKFKHTNRLVLTRMRRTRKMTWKIEGEKKTVTE